MGIHQKNFKNAALYLLI